MSDRNPAPPTKFLRLAADIFDLHPIGGLGKVQMHVDFDIEVARDRKYPVDLAARVAVEIRNGADRPRAPAQALDQQLFGAGIVGESLLREDAQFHIQCPGIVARELLDRFETDHCYARIEFDMGAHAHRATHDAAFQGPLAACVNVLDREIAFGCRGFPNGFGDGSFLDPATVEDAGLVEMDMRLDQAGGHEATRSFQFRRIYLEGR